MTRTTTYRIAMLLAAAVFLIGSLWLCPRLLDSIVTETVGRALSGPEIPVDKSLGYYNQSGERPESFGQMTGIVLPEGTTPVYMIHSENLLPPYRLEAQVTLPSSSIASFLKSNAFTLAPKDTRDLSFLMLSSDLPPDLRPTSPQDEVYIRTGIDSTSPVWWTYVLDKTSGNLWIQYNSE
jgi:hypothetical protein